MLFFPFIYFLGFSNGRSLVFIRSPQAGFPEGAVHAIAAFSPDGFAFQRICQLIDAAEKTIELSAYYFTSQRVAEKLIAAKKRGVEVRIVVDAMANFTLPPSKSSTRSARKVSDPAFAENHHPDTSSHKPQRRPSIAILSMLQNGIQIRANKNYSIHHDKFILVDAKHLETGSFNYTEKAIKRNSENCLILYNTPEMVNAFYRHWQSRYEAGLPAQDLLSSDQEG